MTAQTPERHYRWFQTHPSELAWDDWHGCLLLSKKEQLLCNYGAQD